MGLLEDIGFSSAYVPLCAAGAGLGAIPTRRLAVMETAWEQGPIGFGDNVRVLSTSVTEEAGVAGLEGNVYGETTPSVTDVEVIGSADRDYAINVYFEEPGQSLWFAPDLLEPVDHAPGTTIRLDGVDKEWTRTADGEWVEESLESPERNPWWKFWQR